MKQTQPTRPNKANRSTRLVDARRLAEVRGGGDSEIAVAGGTVTADIWQFQHNEALIQI